MSSAARTVTRGAEDQRFVVGKGDYVGGIQLHGMGHAVLVLSTHAHALIRALGAARGACDTLVERSIDASNAPVKPPVPRSPGSRLPRAAAIIDSVEASLSQLAARINAQARAGVVASSHEKLRGRLALGYAAEQLVNAVEIMLPLVGARGLGANDTVQRAWRDVHAVAQHVALTWDVQAGLFADVLFGHPCPDPKI